MPTSTNASGLRPGPPWNSRGGSGPGGIHRTHPLVLQARVGLKAADRTPRFMTMPSASVRTKGIIGIKFIKLSSGGSEKLIPPGGTIINTESGMDLEELLGTYIHGKVWRRIISSHGISGTPSGCAGKLAALTLVLVLYDLRIESPLGSGAGSPA